MPAIAFPDIRPTGRSYSPGRYPQAEFEALNGASTILRYGNRRTRPELSLDFQNITDDNAARILANFDQQMAGGDWVTFSTANGLAGASPSLAAYMGETISGLRWRYAEPPQVESVLPGRSTVRVRLTGYLDG
jgi:hypothetical protein